MLAEDEQDSVRLLVVENASTVASFLSETAQSELMLPVIRSFSKVSRPQRFRLDSA